MYTYLSLYTTCYKLTSSANCLVSDGNTREQLVGLILALDYSYSKVLNTSFCTHLMGRPFFSGLWSTTVYTPLSMEHMYWC